MRPSGSASLRVAMFAILALASLGLKAAAGPTRDRAGTGSGEFERIAADMLQSEHFSTSLRGFRYRTTLVLATRGSCRVAVRDAADSGDLATVFAQDVSAIGPVRYLYRGNRYSRPPQIALRLRQLETEAMGRLGLERSTPAIAAFAASPTCGDGDYGLGDIHLGA